MRGGPVVGWRPPASERTAFRPRVSPYGLSAPRYVMAPIPPRYAQWKSPGFRTRTTNSGSSPRTFRWCPVSNATRSPPEVNATADTTVAPTSSSHCSAGTDSAPGADAGPCVRSAVPSNVSSAPWRIRCLPDRGDQKASQRQDPRGRVGPELLAQGVEGLSHLLLATTAPQVQLPGPQERADGIERSAPLRRVTASRNQVHTVIAIRSLPGIVSTGKAAPCSRVRGAGGRVAMPDRVRWSPAGIRGGLHHGRKPARPRSSPSSRGTPRAGSPAPRPR